jgi:hypothetical protein
MWVSWTTRARLRGIRFSFGLAYSGIWGYNSEVPHPSEKCSTCGHPKALHGTDWGCKAGHTELIDGVRHIVVCACQRIFPISREKRAA